MYMSSDKKGGKKPNKILGKGAFGRVYLVNHPKRGEMVMKESISRNKPEYEMNLNEVRVLEYLTKHVDRCPWNIMIYAHKPMGDMKLRILMEYFEGHDLSKIQGSLDFSPEGDGYGKWMMVCTELIKAVHCIHSLDVVHRDIKLENIMFDNSNLKLVDFGMACHREDGVLDGLTCTASLGTPFYFSPELWKKSPMTWENLRSSDVWALANVLYALIYGKKLFDHPDATKKSLSIAVMRGTAQIRLDRSVGVDLHEHHEKIHGIIGRMLVLNPEKRLENFEALHTELTAGPRK